jgi:hypothetical protein
MHHNEHHQLRARLQADFTMLASLGSVHRLRFVREPLIGVQLG